MAPVVADGLIDIESHLVEDYHRFRDGLRISIVSASTSLLSFGSEAAIALWSAVMWPFAAIANGGWIYIVVLAVLVALSYVRMCLRFLARQRDAHKYVQLKESSCRGKQTRDTSPSNGYVANKTSILAALPSQFPPPPTGMMKMRAGIIANRRRDGTDVGYYVVVANVSASTPRRTSEARCDLCALPCCLRVCP